VALEEMPLSPNGKVDRRKLPAPEPPSGAELQAQVPPRNSLEALIARIWVEVLGFEVASVEANFFEIGGNSLLATQVIAMLQDVLPIELPLRKVFEGPTVAGLARIIESVRSELGEHEQRIMSEILLEFEQGMSAQAL
jgi:acyl carrier protein